MYWLAVKIDPGKGYDPVDNIVNVDNIVRFGPRDNGTKSYMRFVDGNSLDLLDAFPQLCDELTRAKETE